MRALAAVVFIVSLTTATSAAAGETPAAQWPAPFAVWERPGIAVFLGRTSNGETDRSAEWDVSAQVPLHLGWSLRLDGAKTRWFFNRVPPDGGPYVREGVDVASVRGAIVHLVHPGPLLTPYAGVGYGAYRYRFAESPLHNPWRSGVHALGGFEVGRAAQRVAFTGELRLHLAHAPQQRPVTASELLKLDGAIGIRLRF
jgi:hypothetical protein